MFGGRRSLLLFCLFSFFFSFASQKAAFGGNEAPVIGVSKELLSLTGSGALGIVGLHFRVRVENFGNVPLTGVQVVDDLNATLPPPAFFFSADVLTTGMISGSGTMVGNPAYDGDGDDNLLLPGASSLGPGAVGQITLTVSFHPRGVVGDFFNQVVASGTSPLGTTVTDLSDNGGDPDPDGDGNPTESGENDPTPFSVDEHPSVGAAKRVNGPVVDHGDGSFSVNFVLVVETFGNVHLTNLGLVDDLAATFPAPAAILAVTAPAASLLGGTGVMNANPAFDGVDDTQLLLPSSSLDYGAQGQVSFSVTFERNSPQSAFFNHGVASGQGPKGTIATDLSDDGSDPDPNGDSLPNGPGEDNSTVIILPSGFVNAIGIAKNATGVTDHGDGTFTVAIVLRVENLGNTRFDFVQVGDDLDLAFPAPASVVLVTAPTAAIVSGTGALTVNPAFDGSADQNLLVSDTSTLDPGAIGEIQFEVTFDPADQTQFFNSATASGTNPLGTFTDTSDNGTEPDGDGDGNANEPGENNPTPIVLGGPVVEVPVAGPRGLALLAGLLLAAGFVLLRRGG